MGKRLFTVIAFVMAISMSAACTAASPEITAAQDQEAASAQNPQSQPSAASDADVVLALDQTERSSAASPDADSNAQAAQTVAAVTYPVVDTGQVTCYDDRNAIPCPAEGDAYYGQDGQVAGLQPAYQDNGDGTITDLNTGLMWIQDAGDKMTYAEGVALAESVSFAGYDDWRMPTIKELYSLMDFSGIDDAEAGTDPFIDNSVFVFEYGDVSAGDRAIDSQWMTSTIYTSTVMGGQECFFGVNFADGRIKCYPTWAGGNNGYFLRLVRGNSYGENAFVDNGDGTISDAATGLTWQQADSGAGMDWGDALYYCENLSLGGYDDWRLPDAKELQSIVDYSRGPDATGSAAIDPVFATSAITNEAGQSDYPFFWSSTTHLNRMGGGFAAYVSFGRALGYFNNQWMDVHGAGAQRSDPKAGDAADFPSAFGPQGDVRRLLNYARCVRGGSSSGVVADGGPAAVGDQPVVEAPSGQAPTGDAGSGQDPAQGANQPPTTGDQPPQNGGQLPANGQQPVHDLQAAAAQLGVTVDALRAALGDPAQGPPDLAAAAAQLGVTEAALRAALGIPAGGPPTGGGQP